MSIKTLILVMIVAAGTAMLAACSSEDSEQQQKNRANLDRLAEENHVSFSYDAGLHVSTRVPEQIDISSASGETNLERLLEDGPAVLVFVRSVEWCNHCQAELIAVSKEVPIAEAKGYKIYATSNDAPEILAKFAKVKNCLLSHCLTKIRL